MKFFFRWPQRLALQQHLCHTSAYFAMTFMLLCPVLQAQLHRTIESICMPACFFGTQVYDAIAVTSVLGRVPAKVQAFFCTSASWTCKIPGEKYQASNFPPKQETEVWLPISFLGRSSGLGFFCAWFTAATELLFWTQTPKRMKPCPVAPQKSGVSLGTVLLGFKGSIWKQEPSKSG